MNSCHPLRRSPHLFCSGADDCKVKVWDVRVKRSVQTFTERFPVTAVAFADAGDVVFAGGVENTIKASVDVGQALLLRISPFSGAPPLTDCPWPPHNCLTAGQQQQLQQYRLARTRAAPSPFQLRCAVLGPTVSCLRPRSKRPAADAQSPLIARL